MRYCGNEIISFAIPADGIETIHLNYNKPVDKIRLTLFDTTSSQGGYHPGLLIWSSLVNNYIGTCSTQLVSADGVGNYDFSKSCKQNNGLSYWYPNKIIINGDHDIRVTKFDGSLPTNIANEIYLLVEYFSY